MMGGGRNMHDAFFADMEALMGASMASRMASRTSSSSHRRVFSGWDDADDDFFGGFSSALHHGFMGGLMRHQIKGNKTISLSTDSQVEKVKYGRSVQDSISN